MVLHDERNSPPNFFAFFFFFGHTLSPFEERGLTQVPEISTSAVRVRIHVKVIQSIKRLLPPSYKKLEKNGVF